MYNCNWFRYVPIPSVHRVIGAWILDDALQALVSMRRFLISAAALIVPLALASQNSQLDSVLTTHAHVISKISSDENYESPTSLLFAAINCTGLTHDKAPISVDECWPLVNDLLSIAATEEKPSNDPFPSLEKWQNSKHLSSVLFALKSHLNATICENSKYFYKDTVFYYAFKDTSDATQSILDLCPHVTFEPYDLLIAIVPAGSDMQGVNALCTRIGPEALELALSFPWLHESMLYPIQKYFESMDLMDRFAVAIEKRTARHFLNPGNYTMLTSLFQLDLYPRDT